MGKSKTIKKGLFEILAISAMVATVLAIIPFLTGKNTIMDLIKEETSSLKNSNVEIQSFNAMVNSPNDGFLALRSQPSVIRGIRLTKIPHLEKIFIYNCENTTKRDHNAISGHWCKCDYKGKKGWIFDAYVLRLEKEK